MSIKITNGPRTRRANAPHTKELFEGAYLAGPYHDPENDEYSWTLYTWLEGRDMEKAQDAALEAVGSGADFIDEWEPIHKSDARRWLLDIRDEQEFPGEPARPDWARITIAKSRRENKGMRRQANSKVVRGGKAKAVKNLGWLLQHWKDIESFEVTEGGARDVTLRAWLHTVDDGGIKTRYPDRGPTSGDYYETDFADRGVLAEFLQRPVFEGTPIKWLGKSLKVGKALNEFVHPTRRNNPRSAPDKYGDRYGYHMSLSYGELPPKGEFFRIWDDELGGGRYSWDLKGQDRFIMQTAVEGDDLEGVTSSGVKDADSMYAFLKALVDMGWGDDNDQETPVNLDLASGILHTLGIEWV